MENWNEALQPKRGKTYKNFHKIKWGIIDIDIGDLI